MALPAPLHRCQVFATPWPGVHGVRTESARSFGRHLHGTFGIGWLEAGAQRSASGRGQVEAFAGDLLAHNPGEVHDGHPLGGPVRRWSMLHLEPAVLAGMAGRPGALELVRPVMRDQPLRQALALALRRLLRWQPQGAASAVQRLACEEALAQACGLLLAGHANLAVPAPAGGDLARVRERLADDLLHTPSLDELAALAGLGRYQLLRRFARVRERLADDLLHTPSLDELAALAGLGRYQLLRRFARAHGLPPHAWLLQQRAERARRLVRDGSSLADAALASGFADQSHMTRVFSRQFGYTPGAWQAALQ